MNPRIQSLHPYPFEKLAALTEGLTPPAEHPPIRLSIGEPKHAPPAFVAERLSEDLGRLAEYPVTRGERTLRASIAEWLERRFRLTAAPDPDRHVLPVNGTREALFAFTQASLDPSAAAKVVLPNPFYQIYEGAALLAGAEPYYLDCHEALGWLPDLEAVPASVWQQCQLIFICSPGNPTGRVWDRERLNHLIELADRHDFIIAADECYSEIHFGEPPTGLLEVCAERGRDDYRRCVVFHSLSKRSNLPSLRSGFVAGDAALLAPFLKYRTYHGCALPLPSQTASAAAWADEAHVEANRRAYRAKFEAVVPILREALELEWPEAGFYLWPRTPIDDESFARRLYAEHNVTVLPGRYLSRPTAAGDPGANRVRMALVAPEAECVEAAERVVEFVRGL